MDHKQVIEMLEWLQKLWTDNDRLKPIEYYTLSARTKHTTFSTSFSQESQERVTQALDQAINCVGAIEQIKWERDIAIQQLNELGYQLGEKKRTSTWLLTDAYPHRLFCHNCYKTTLYNFEMLQSYYNDFKYCPYCKCEMTNIDEVKGILEKYLNDEEVDFTKIGK